MAYSPSDRTQIVAMLFIVALYGAHFLVFMWPQPFYIEDSAISFSYARNLIEGEGLVPYPGGERVEGYSNALWTFLLAAAYALRIEPWASAKLLGWVFGSITLFFTWGIARRARPEANDPVSLAAPILLACSTQFVVWNASGLENSLFNVLLAGGIWSLTREIQEDRRVPWSALAFVGLTMTRPDGVMYAALGLFGRLLGTVARRQWSATALWIVAFAVPFVGYNAWRYDYFGLPFPNTYYAKEKDFKPFNWTGGAWKQVRDYTTMYGVIYAAPLAVVAMTGLSTWRRWVGVVVLAFLAVFLLWDGRAGIPASMTGEWSRVLSRHYTNARVWYLLGAAVVLGLTTFGRKGWEARGLLWGAWAGGVFFVVATGADWMKGFRWFSLTSVPTFTLIGVGIGAVAERLPFAMKRLAGWLPVRSLWATPMVVALAVPNVNGSWTFANSPETSPRDVHKRVKYMTWVQRRLGLEQVTLLDVDMGAHMWWSGWDLVDIAGLVDVPMSQHKKFNRKFISQYIFEERRPDFAHVHGSWARTSKIHLNERWDDDYIEIPGYPSGKRALHVGNHVRKEHIVGAAYAGPAGRQVAFASGLTLEGWELPSPEIAPGGKLYVSTTWRTLPREAGFRVVAFLVGPDGAFHSAEVAPGYDWYKPEAWQPNEYVYGKWAIAVPEGLPKGTYDFGLVLLDEATGAVLPYMPVAAAPAPAVEGGSALAVDAPAPPGGETLAPVIDANTRYMAGEWVVAGAVTIVGFEDAVAKADADFAEVKRRAASGDCEGSAESFRNARRHIARNDKWALAHVDEATEVRVACLVERARPIADPLAQAAILAEATRLDHWHEGLRALSLPLAQQLVEQGQALADAEKWTDAYAAYHAALSIDTSLSHVRVAAERVRDLSLEIDPEKADAAVPTKKPATPKTPKKGSPADAANKALNRKPKGAAPTPKVAPDEAEAPVPAAE